MIKSTIRSINHTRVYTCCYNISSSKYLKRNIHHSKYYYGGTLLGNQDEASQSINKINFNDTKVFFKSKSTIELFRGLLVFSLCRINVLVSKSEQLMKLSYHMLGSTITDKLLKLTFFGHFCAGEDEVSIKPTLKALQSSGIGSILDYAAESDLLSDLDTRNSNDDLYDSHKETFEKCIHAVKNVSTAGFAAVKVTALGDPELLRRASLTLIEIRKLFDRLDPSNTGFITKEVFHSTFSAKVDDKDSISFFESIDQNHDGKIDYIEWTSGLRLQDLHLITAHCTIHGPLYNSVLTESER